jgi:ABC-type multidrug transport system permease subunit
MVHSWLRWAFLIAALFAIIRSLNGKFGNKPFGKEDNTAATILIALTHTMLLLGIILWFVSPNVQNALAQGACVFMKDKYMRLIVIEHPLTNIIAVALIQIGRIKSKKAYEDAVKHNRSLIYYGLGLLLILSRIPWGTSPLFRGME